MEKCVKMKTHFAAFSKHSRRLKMIDFHVFVFAYITDVFLIFRPFGGVKEGQILIPTGILKQKSTSAVRRLQGVILDAQEGAKCWNFSVRKMLYFPYENEEFDASEVPNVKS